MTRLTIIAACLMTTAAVAGPASITGPAYVIDGDTVVVGTTHVRLKGVDAAERGTPLGDEATQVMRGIVNGGTLTCVLTGEKAYNPQVGYCMARTITGKLLRWARPWPARATAPATCRTSSPKR